MRLYKFNHSKFLINKLLEGQFLKNKGSVQTAEESETFMEVVDSFFR